LDFKGRVTIASKKNFIVEFPPATGKVLEGKDKAENSVDGPILMLFGKAKKHVFSLDYAPPMSCIQAFAVALTTFAYKLVVT